MLVTFAAPVLGQRLADGERALGKTLDTTDVDGFIASVGKKIQVRVQPGAQGGNDATSVLLSAAALPASESTTP